MSLNEFYKNNRPNVRYRPNPTISVSFAGSCYCPDPMDSVLGETGLKILDTLPK